MHIHITLIRSSDRNNSTHKWTVVFDFYFFLKAELFLSCGKLSNERAPVWRRRILGTWYVGDNFIPAKVIFANML